jgi:predicted nucleotidyltransferase
MTAGEIAEHLLGCCSTLAKFEAYMFGSSLRGIGEDIDILVVGPCGDSLSQLKVEIAVAEEELPLHMLYMLPSEAWRSDFVAREKCVLLAQLASVREV